MLYCEIYRDNRKTLFFVMGLVLLWLSYYNFDTVNNKALVDRKDNITLDILSDWDWKDEKCS